jgi:purine catabolism regulator
MAEWAKRRTVRKVALMNLLLTVPDPDLGVMIALGGDLLTRKPLLVCATSGARANLNSMAERLADTFGETIVAAEAQGSLIAIAGFETHFQSIVELALHHDLRTGTAKASSCAELAQAVKNATTAMRSAGNLRRLLVPFEDMQSMLLPDFIDDEAFGHYSHDLLAPLEEYRAEKGIDLVRSLRVWLEHHGHLSHAASALEMHRHTLRYQLAKANQLLGEDLDSVDLRMRLWLAIAYRESSRRAF